MADIQDAPDPFEAMIHLLFEQLSHLPGFIREPMERKLRELLPLIRNQRAPRFMLIGRRGSGKSTLINAMFSASVRPVGNVFPQTGEATWLEYQRGGKVLEILDTRGVQEGSTPVEPDKASNAVDSILGAVKDKCPDVILFLAKATEVDAAIKGDLGELERVLKGIERQHGRRLPLLGVLTQCDQLAPADIIRLPTGDPEKNKNIADACDRLSTHLRSREAIQTGYAKTIPVASWAYFRADGSIDASRDLRWNIDVLVGELLKELPQETQINWARLAEIRKFQKALAMSIVSICATACGAIGLQPIPVADFPILTTIQGMMILAIAQISGRELSPKGLAEFGAALGVEVGLGLVLKEAARALLKLVPGWGNFVSGGIAFAATQAIGMAAIAYFIDQVSMEKAREFLKRARPGK